MTFSQTGRRPVKVDSLAVTAVPVTSGSGLVDGFVQMTQVTRNNWRKREWSLRSNDTRCSGIALCNQSFDWMLDPPVERFANVSIIPKPKTRDRPLPASRDNRRMAKWPRIF